MNSSAQRVRVSVMTGAMCVLTLAVGSGCQHFVNPFVDELANRPPISTPSADAAMAYSGEATSPDHAKPPIERYAADGTVVHGVLYFEDPFVTRGSDDGKCAWTYEDGLHSVYGPASFLVNAVLVPIRAVLTPPWVLLASDGDVTQRASSRYDNTDQDTMAGGASTHDQVVGGPSAIANP